LRRSRRVLVAFAALMFVLWRIIRALRTQSQQAEPAGIRLKPQDGRSAEVDSHVDVDRPVVESSPNLLRANTAHREPAAKSDTRSPGQPRSHADKQKVAQPPSRIGTPRPIKTPTPRSVMPPVARPRPRSEPDFRWTDSGSTLVGAAPWISSNRLELHGEHAGHQPLVWIDRPPEVKDLMSWDGVHELLIKKPSGGIARIVQPTGSRIRLDDELRGEESGYVDVQVLRTDSTVIEKVRFGYCPAFMRLKTDIRWDGSGLFVARTRSVVIVHLESGLDFEIPRGTSSLTIPSTVVQGEEACAFRTSQGDWVYVRFKPWR